MVKYYAKQIDPEWQEDDLFWVGKTKQGRSKLCWNNDAYVEDVIIDGNDDYLEYHTNAYEKVKKIDDILYEYEMTSNPHSNGCYWDNVSQLINWYLSKENGKNYTKQEIHQWKLLLDNWNNYHDEEENELQALQLITGKKWRQATIRGCMQREYQYLYVSEIITEKDIKYIEMCYFNTGSEWRIYESKEDFENGNDAFSLYVDSFDSKAALIENLGCEEDEIEVYEFGGYTKTATYNLI